MVVAMRNLTSSILFALPFMGYQPANISYDEPALQAANLVKQTMLGAPFIWPWNRGLIEAAPIIQGSQDFEVDIPDFGFLEQAWLFNPANEKVKEFTVVKSLSAESAIARPQSVAAQFQEPGTVGFLLNTLPDQDYTMGGYYQRAPNQMSSLAATWAPIPDNLAYIYDWGFLAMLSMITKDVRTPFFMQKFVSHLLGAQDGLTALQRNIFIGDWLTILTQPERANINVQTGNQARSGT
jgi:hypothetical protein